MEQDFEDELLIEQRKFIESKNEPSAKVYRTKESSEAQIVSESFVPPVITPSIVPKIVEIDEDRDFIDVMGPIDPKNVPGVSISSKTQETSKPKSKSLFALQREKNRSKPSQDSTKTSELPHFHKDSSVPPILSDLVESDVISFNLEEKPVFRSQNHKQGFPAAIHRSNDPIKLENEEKVDQSEANKEKQLFKPFYSSARDRLIPTRSIEVVEDEEDESDEFEQDSSSLNQGKGQISTLMQEISTENEARLQGMSSDELLKLKEELFASMNPKFIELLKSRGKGKQNVEQNQNKQNQNFDQNNQQKQVKQDQDEENEVVTSTGVYRIPERSRKPQNGIKKRLNDIESMKREWMKPIASHSTSNNISDVNNASIVSRESGTRTHMDAEFYRFDFEGRLLSYPSSKGNIELESIGKTQDLNMLLHHGDDPTLPGYTIDELSHLSRSTHPSQRISAIRGLGNIIFKSKHSYYQIPQLKLATSIHSFPSSLFLSYMIQSASIGIQLRISIDDTSNTVVLEALQALHALLCSESDEIIFSLAELTPETNYSWYPLQPRDEDNLSSAKRDWDDKSDSERCEEDLILALLQTGILNRFRYLLESKNYQNIATIIFDIMIRISRHSNEAALHFQQCPRLIQIISSQFIAKPQFMQSLISKTEQNLQKSIENQTQDHINSYRNTALAVKLMRIISQANRTVCKSCLDLSVVSSCLKFIIPTEDSKDDKDNQNSSENSIKSKYLLILSLETYKLIETCLRYGYFSSGVINILPVLLESASSKSYTIHKHSRQGLIKAAIWRIFEALVPLARDVPEGSIVPPSTVLWSFISPILGLSLSSLRNFIQTDQSSSQKKQDVYSDDDEELSSILQFVAAYFDHLHSHPPRSYDDEKGQIRNIAQNIIGPLMVSSSRIQSPIFKLSSKESWTNTSSPYYNLVPKAPYNLSLKSLPVLSWKAQKLATSLDNWPSTTIEQKHELFLQENLPGSSIIHHSAVILAALHAISAIHKHDQWLSSFLTASEIAGPLTSILEHYVEFAMASSNSLASVFLTRTIHHLAFQTIKLLYHGSLVAQETALVCLGFLLPGDESKALYLMQRVIFHYQQDSDGTSEDHIQTSSLPKSGAKPKQVDSSSLARRLDISPGLLNFFAISILEGREVTKDSDSSDSASSDPEAHDSIEAKLDETRKRDVVSTRPSDRDSLLIHAEGSSLPLGKSWPYHPIIQYSKHRTNEKTETSMRRRERQHNAIEKAIEAHRMASQSSQTKIKEEIEISDEYLGDEDALDEEATKLLEAGKIFISDCLKLIKNLEIVNAGFTSKMKRSTKIYTLMQCLILGPEFFASEPTSTLLQELLSKFISVAWEPFNLAFTLNPTIVERTIDVWSNESFGHSTISSFVALWILVAGGIDTEQLKTCGQTAELSAIDSAIWPQFSALWHLLPNPPKSLEHLYFNKNTIFRPHLVEHFFSSLCSPHVGRMRTSQNFWYTFIIFQLNQYLWSEETQNINRWTRLNSLAAWIVDSSVMGSTAIRELVLFDLCADQPSKLLTELESQTLESLSEHKIAFLKELLKILDSEAQIQLPTFFKVIGAT